MESPVEVPVAQRRWAGLAGVISVVLLVPASFVTILAGNQPSPDARTNRIVSYLSAHRGVYLSSLLFEIVSLALLVWFITVLAAVLTGDKPSLSWLGTLSVVGAVGFSVFILVEDAAFAAAARLAGRSGLGPTIRGLWEFGYQAAWPFARGFMALLLIPLAVAIDRTGRLPRQVSRFALAAAAVNVAFLPTLFVRHGAYQAGGFLAHATASLIFELWVLDAAAVLLRSRSRASTP
jgi:hypothetical protein